MSGDVLRGILRPSNGASRKLSRRSAAVIGVDVKGYSALMSRDESATHRRVGAAMARLISQIEASGGEVFSFSGDGLMALLPDAARAIDCAIRLQREAARRNARARPAHRLLYRVGINTGQVVVQEERVGGNAVNIAARLEQIAVPGTIFLTELAHAQAGAAASWPARRLGPIRLKNIRDPVVVYRIDNPDASSAEEIVLEQDEPARVEPSPGAGQVPRLAVLPLYEAEDIAIPRHISEGLMADIVCQLAGLRDVRVTSHGSTVRLRDGGADPRALGRQLGVRYLLRGMIRRASGTLRLATELVEAETGLVAWAQTRDFATLLGFADQDRIVGEIVATLAPHVREAELDRIRGKRTGNLSAYELTLLARQKLLALDVDGFSAARELIERAIALDPDYAEAYALAADWHGLRLSQTLSPDRAADQRAAERYGEQALARDRNNVRALMRFGHRKALLHRDFDTALKLFDRTLNAAPHSAHAWMWSSHTFAYIGEADEAVRRANYALELSPCDVEAHYFLGALCIAQYSAGTYDAAADAGLRALAEPRPSRAFRPYTVAALVAAGRTAEAQPIVEEILADQPDFSVRARVERAPFKDRGQADRWGAHLLQAGLQP